jgi:acyl transferase domain-containing protein
MNSPQELSASKQALLKIRELKKQLAQANSFSGEPIAIVSMACRFPRHSNTPEAFWDSLIKQTDQVGDIPDDRWDHDAFHDDDPEVPGKMYARRGVFLEGLDQMDPEFFGISPREATWVDPQQRLLLEVGWEALQRAGWPTAKIAARTGVFVGWMHNDYQNEASDSFLNLNPYIATGAAGSFLSGRLAYYLGLEGPALAVDTACSSSLVAMHLAIQSIQRGDCDRALVGGVNAICSPTTNILTCKLKALSPTGQSRAFDAAADGYLRGEGCGVVTLRRLADAQADGDSVLGVIRGSSIGHNGFSSGLTAPNPAAQEKVIREALERAKITPDEVGYLEAHGTGTELGDPIEMRAAAAALSGSRTKENPLLVGSVKTNIGHLEAAAGMAGLIKVLLSMQHGQIPGQLNFETPNPHIPWDEIPVEVLTEVKPWPKGKRRIAGVSAFGMSGTNAHVVIEAPEPTQQSPTDASPADAKNGSANPPQLIVVSAKNEDALETLAANFSEALGDSNNDSISLADVAYTSTACRDHFDHRIAVVSSDSATAADTLQTLSRGGTSEAGYVGHARRAPKLAWQFTGQGAQYAGMAKGLFDSCEVFRESVLHCDRVLQQLRGESLLDVLFHDQTGKIDDTRWTQPALFAVQMGLAKRLLQLGVQPDLVLGHSVGQYAAACVAGIMSWDDGLRLIAERGRLIGDLPAGGSMLAVFASEADVAAAIADAQAVSIAALNGTHTVVSGPADDVKTIEKAFAAKSVRVKALTTSHAFHSQLMEPALDEFRTFADSITFSPATIPLVCNVTGQILPADRVLDSDYWADHIRQAVRFADGVNAAQEAKCEVLLELGPQAVLTRMAAAVWTGKPGTLIGSLQRDADDDASMLKTLGQLYVRGITPDFETLHAATSENKDDVQTTAPRRVLLPTYPFQRRRFWGPDKPSSFHADYHTAHPLLGSEVALAGMDDQKRFESFVEPDSPAWLPDHEVMNNVVMPGAAWMEMAIQIAARKPLTQLRFEQPLRPVSRTALQTIVKPESAVDLAASVDSAVDHASENTKPHSIETFSCPAGSRQWSKHFVASFDQAADLPEPPALIDRDSIANRCGETVEPQAFYQRMQELGLNYGPKFQTVDSFQFSETEVLTRLVKRGDERGFTLPPTVLDGALHSLAVGLTRGDADHLFLPVAVDRLHCLAAVENEIWCHAVWTQNEGKTRSADLVLFNDDGVVVAKIDGLQVQQVSVAALRQMSGAGAERLVYGMDWQPLRLPASTTKQHNWLLIESEGASMQIDDVAGKLVEQRQQVTRVILKPESTFEALAESTYAFDGSDAKQWETLFDHLTATDEEGTETPFELHGIAWQFASAIGPHVSTTDGLIPAATQTQCRSFLNLVHELARREIRSLECGLQLLTANAISLPQDPAVADSDEAETHPPVDPNQTQYWGLGRVLGAEQPEYRCRLIDVNSAEQNSAASVTDILLTETRDSQLVIRDGQFFVPRLKQRKLPAKKESTFADGFSTRPQHSYLITGGLGMLGREAAKWLADNGADQVVLVSRREPDEATRVFLETISESGCDAVVHCADFGNADEVRALFDRFGGGPNNDLLPLAGVIHAAGVLDDGLIGTQTWERFEKILAPKIIGASLLDELTRDLPLDFFVLYSSAASVLGSPGQSNYATANAFMDGLAWRRQQLGLPAISINWGPWSAGMAADERIAKRLALQGITALAIDESHAAMEKILVADQTQATVIDAQWQRMRMGLGGESPPLLESVAPGKQSGGGRESQLVAKLKQLQGNARRELLQSVVSDSLQRILSTDGTPETDRPLIEMGLDSLMAVEFGTELQTMLGDQFAVGPTMLFDHPTIEAITTHVLELVEEQAGAGGSTSGSAATADKMVPAIAAAQAVERDDVAIVGMSCRFPGAHNVEEFWQNLLAGVDSVREIPDDRWDIDRFYSADREPGKMYTREGGFLEDIGDFDPAFFNISPQEACWIDPQHRMLLENSYLAMEDAGICPRPLADANVGVFMGIMGQDYAFLPTLDDENVIEAFQGAGLSHSAGVGRISYVFGFEGPSVAVDTASSSSLVALFQAVRSLQDGNCNLALAGGVNAILAPVNSLLMSKAGLLSADGRCKSFSAEASGFGRGEGCGVVVLKRLKDARRDGDRVLAVVKGAAVVHNGFSSGITSPSGKAQARVIAQALTDARVAPSEVQYLEAHGTGTEYGDPMEIGAAAKVYGQGRTKDKPLLVGSVKANISHLEAAGGVSGLIKAVLSISRGVIPQQAHFEAPSPHVPWQRMPVQMVTENTPWPETEQRLAGVTALGLVGTNAHVVLSDGGLDVANELATNKADTDEQPTTPDEAAADSTSELLVVSARNEAALKSLVERYVGHLKAGSLDQASFGDCCYTATVGRRHFEHRLALVAGDAAGASEQLERWLQDSDGSHIHAGVAASSNKVAWQFNQTDDLDWDAVRRLYAEQPDFRAFILQLDQRLNDHLASSENAERDLLTTFFDSEEATSEQIEAGDLHAYAVQAALANLWQSWGVQSDVVVGTGVGQYVASAVAGAICFQDAAVLVHERSHIRAASEADQTAMLDTFEALADGFNFYPPNMRLICSVSGDVVPIHRSLAGSYWRDHVLADIDGTAAMETLAGEECSITMSLDGSTLVGNGLASVLKTAAELYVQGIAIDFASLHRHASRKRASLPLYPFQKQRYWITEVDQHLPPKS